MGEDVYIPFGLTYTCLVLLYALLLEYYGFNVHSCFERNR